MRSRTSRVLVALAGVALLTSCAGDPATGDAAPSSRGIIELATSEACAAGSTAECIMVNGESITSPTSYQSATVQNVAVAPGNGQGSVAVTFTDEGGAVLAAVTKQAVDAGNRARLVLKVGDRILGAPVVLEPLTDRAVSLSVPPGERADDLVAAILGR